MAATMGHYRGDQRGSGPLCAVRNGWAFSECSSGSRHCYSRYIISFIFTSTSPMARWIKNLPAVQETQEMWVQSLDQEEPLEKKMATYSSIFAWRIRRTAEPGGLQSTGSQRGRHN